VKVATVSLLIALVATALGAQDKKPDLAADVIWSFDTGG
jgi:hypothetical protein